MAKADVMKALIRQIGEFGKNDQPIGWEFDGSVDASTAAITVDLPGGNHCIAGWSIDELKVYARANYRADCPIPRTCSYCGDEYFISNPGEPTCGKPSCYKSWLDSFNDD